MPAGPSMELMASNSEKQQFAVAAVVEFKIIDIMYIVRQIGEMALQ
jgi:hypothetical protein